ncbi:MAG: transcriptional regulator [Phycisphaeraceae bacterium]|nr:MAG: transcriptional regulator [Phycisphaeraceae bacterium]
MSTLQHQLGKREPFRSATQEAHLNVVRTAAALEGGFARLFRAHGLTGSSYNALRILRGAGPSTCSQIGDHLVVRVPDVTRLIDRLAARGFVERARSDEDRRVVRVAITDAGRVLLAGLDGPVEALHTQQLNHMDAGELRELSRLLEKARAGANTPATPGAPL